MRKTLLIILGLILFFTVSGSYYTVSETEQVIITRFGKPVGEPINSTAYEAGIHFKIPFVDTVNRIEKRVLEWDGPASDMPTRDKLYISVDNFARWRIEDPLKYFQSLRDERSARSRLDDIIGSKTLEVIAAHDLIEVVRSDKDREPKRDEMLAAGNSNYGTLPPIKYGRSRLDREIFDAAAPKVELWGIKLLDVRFKRINYKSGVIDKIFARMTSERIQIADRFRSEGAGEAAKIMGRKEQELLRIESGAYRTEQEIMGKADATATGIYAQAYTSSPTAAKFYQFTKTLETYRKTLGRDTTTIFTTNGDLFGLMKRITPVADSAADINPLPVPRVIPPPAPPAAPTTPAVPTAPSPAAPPAENPTR